MTRESMTRESMTRGSMTRESQTRGRLMGSMALVAGCLVARDALERTMWLHMLVQIPLLIAAGVIASGVIASRTTSPESGWLSRWNRQGMSGLVLAAGGVAFWMIPRWLDAAVGHVGVDVAKALSLWAVGVVGARSWRAAGAIVQLFVLGNTAWMTATVGMLLLDAPTRVCVNYGASDQRLAGYGLLMVTLVVVVKALLRASVAIPVPTGRDAPLSAHLDTL
ncbi:hypothetical protein [Gemmatimonas groenlandica]|uniref:Transmembrane protein n=1 Tax=Gemmatimonas groenlandica TaxID=2732249 RepID=A0A6M4ISP8_9BACT|nr:hypothetical protein [Gemmatimonas groenlandica]QJR36749.1 hypothetical protein HKW67_15110 [Gemmatimonas groenlandica]